MSDVPEGTIEVLLPGDGDRAKVGYITEGGSRTIAGRRGEERWPDENPDGSSRLVVARSMSDVERKVKEGNRGHRR